MDFQPNSISAPSEPFRPRLGALRDPEMWLRFAVPAEERELRSFCSLLNRCPAEVRPAVEARLMRSPLRPAAVYFEQRDRLEEYAVCHNTNADTLRDTLLCKFGFDPSGRRSWTLAGRTCTAEMGADFSITFRDETGRAVKGPPREDADEADYHTVKRTMNRLKKDVPAAARLRTERLFREFLRRTEYTAQRWKTTYPVDPLLRALARRLVWQQGAATFILGRNGVPQDAHGSPAELTDEPIFLAHPMELSAETVSAWQRYLTDRHRRQPFTQMWEPVLDPDSIRPDRWDGCNIPRAMLRHQELHGISLQGEYTLRLAGCHGRVRYDSSGPKPAQPQVCRFRFETYTRQANHIAVWFDRLTVRGRILKDDTSVRLFLHEYSLPQLLELIDLAAQNDCPNVTAVLQQYKREHFSDADPIDAFTLDIL